MIKITNFTKKYKNKVILNDLSYDFDTHGLYIIKGYNGAGKTTLANVLALLDFKYKGTIEIDDVNIKKRRYINHIRSRKIEYVMPKDN